MSMTIPTHNTKRQQAKRGARLTFVILLLFTLLSCEKFDEIDARLETLEQKVSTLESATEALHDFYVQGKVITSVSSLEGGYQITFSDDHQLNIYDGITPMLLIDQEGYWNISYDGGDTYNRMKDYEGKDIAASGASVKTVVDDYGNYVLVQYMSANPDSIISTMTTPLSSDPSKILYSITEDSRSHLITLTMSDGQTFTFNKSHSIPTSIALLNTQTLLLGRNDTVSFEFRVNPSTATFNYDVHAADCQLFLDKVSETRSYVTPPTAYSMVKVEQVYDDMGTMKVGQYRAYIADLDKREPYSDNIALVLNVPSGDDTYLEVSSSAMHIKFTDNTLRDFAFLKANNPTSVITDVHATMDGNQIKVVSPYITDVTHLVPTFRSSGSRVLVNGVSQESGVTPNDYSQPVRYRVENLYGEYTEYTVQVIHSGFPIVFIDTPNKAAITSKTDWLQDAYVTVIGTDGETLYEGDTDIKGRGNASWNFPKKSYNIKLHESASVLGMPEHKRWVLLANWMDRTLMRNRLAFKLGQCTQMAYNPRSEYVELVLNGKHMGNYLLCEQIRIDENRVDIHPLQSSDEDITGGYLMEIDKYYDETYKFRSKVKNFPYMFKEPSEKEFTEEMLTYMSTYIDDMEYNLYKDFYSRKWAEYLDLASFVDFWFAVELVSNDEPSHPKSIYVYKDRGSKLCIGPIWDNDWWTFMPANSQKFILKKYLYYPALFKDQEFVSMVKERWPAAREQFATVADFIDAEAQRLKNSSRINISMWPISLRVNEDETLPFDEAVGKLKRAYTDKLQWLDTQISGL